MILADTNVLSETASLRPNQQVLRWIAANLSKLYIPTPVLAELRYGCEKLPQSNKRRELEAWLANLTIQFSDRIVAFDQSSAEAHGAMRAHLKAAGKHCPANDSYIAAIALAHDCPVATRNQSDFAWTGAALIDPWNA
ncbi:PIN domain-containing protein [Novosphingobium jiangmenense]|uniref:Ribonuclease VapC n=1 Tax=Novosphingobium jiangmenense TaxID=2791981 RepID=A0ABS0HDJ7_9SPHN|nr:PIN domain-containing protein [Novosphingobium jiangmenense]MBF9150208.1 PIN domain-containing protein [Novosphingobium jiangmenense]